MSTIKDGGPAFAIPCEDDRDCGPRFQSGYGGMTLRDAFAIAALSTVGGYSSADLETWSADSFARHAYAIADSMLRARDQEPS